MDDMDEMAAFYSGNPPVVEHNCGHVFFLIGFYQCEASTIWKAKCLELQFWGMKPNRNTKMMGGCGELWGAATGTAVGST